MTDARDFTAAIQRLRPGAAFNLRGDVIEWLDAKQTQPTDQEIQTELSNAPQKSTLRKLAEAVGVSEEELSLFLKQKNQ